jgi:NTP pyrophosphatase (non-canonical NTP hydrolase)
MSETLSDLSALAREVSAIYAERFEIDRDATWYLGKLSEELGEVSAAYFNLVGQGRTDGTRAALEDEVADLLAFVLLFADWQGIDPAAAMRRKWGKYVEPKNDG